MIKNTKQLKTKAKMTSEKVHSTENLRDAIKELSQHFYLSEPATEEQLKAIGSQVDTTIDCLPSTLIDFWSIAGEWHSLKHGHYNVFGFNFYPPEKALSTTCIFGDEELRLQWLEEHTVLAGVSCAGKRLDQHWCFFRI